MNNKIARAIGIVLAAVLTIGIFALGVIVGEENIPDALAFALLGIFLLLPVCIAVNTIGAKRYEKRLLKLGAAEKAKLIMDKQKDAADDLEALIQKRHRSCVKVIVYLAVLVLGLASFAFLSGAMLRENSNPSIALFLVIFYYQEMLFRLLTANRSETDEWFLSEEEYPLLFSLVRDTAKKCGYEGECRIRLHSREGIGISADRSGAILYFGEVSLLLLSEEELRQTLIHEFAHVSDPHIAKYGQEANRLLNFLHVDSPNGTNVIDNLFLSLPYEKLSFEHFLVNTVSSFYEEQRADTMITELGDPAVFIAGLAKLRMFSYFEDYEPKLPPFYEPEKPRENAAELRVNAYLEDYEEHGDIWRYMLEHELPARLDSHPSFPERRAAVGDPDFTIEFPTEDSPYRAECRRLAEYAGKLIAERAEERYAEWRKEAYLDPLAVIEEYESSDKEYSSRELSPVLNAYRDLARYDKAEAVCDGILAKEQNPYATAHALFVKGILLLKRYDKAGIECLYKAAELNENYMDSGMDEIAKFCLRMGLEDEMQRVRETVDGYMEKGLDEYVERGRLSVKDKLVPESFPDDRLPTMIDFMVEAGKGSIEKIYLVRKLIGEGDDSSVFILQFIEGADDKTVGDAYEKIFNYLDTYPDGWQYSLFVFEKNFEKIIKKVPGCCVYEQ